MRVVHTLKDACAERTAKLGKRKHAGVQPGKGEFAMVFVHSPNCPRGCFEVGPREARELGVRIIEDAAQAEAERWKKK